MKSILKFLIVFFVYLILGVVLWGKHDYILPIFISIYIAINLYLIDTTKSYLLNFIELSGISFIAFIISIFISDGDKFVPIQYLILMVLSSLLIFYLKKSSKFSAA